LEEKRKMRLCIPSETTGGLEDQVGYHFGRVQNYTIYDEGTNEVEIIENTSSHRGGTKLPAELLHEHNVDVMICGGIGRRAIQLFEQFGVEIYIGAQGAVRDAIELFKNKKLTMATDKEACQQHKYRGEGTGQGHEHYH
jgi:predicted Fe-Mo cluster-binding NifX family protein